MEKGASIVTSEMLNPSRFIVSLVPYLKCFRCDNNGVRLSTVGKRAFSVSGATVWNSLPPHSTIDEWQIFVKICFVYIFCK